MSQPQIDPSSLSDDALDLLMAVHHLCGERRWPRWARAVVYQQSDTRSQRQFERLMSKAWPHADHQTRGALTTIAAALDVSIPQEPQHAEPAKPQRPRRTLWPMSLLRRSRPDHEREPSRSAAGATGGIYAAQQRQRDDASARRHNRRPGIWQSARDLMDAIHPGREP